jgi:hypothetical protein
MKRVIVAYIIVFMVVVSWIALQVHVDNDQIGIRSAYAATYFEQTFSADNFDHTDWSPAYNFVGTNPVLVGYSSEKIQETYHDWTATGHPDGTGGSHQIPIYGMPSYCDTDLSECGNFNVYVTPDDDLDVTEFYARMCWYLPARIQDDGENWKLAYNYADGGDGFVLWLHATADANGRQPEFTSAAQGEVGKTEAVSTWYMKDFEDQWTCFEWYANVDGTTKLWLTTEDETYNDTLYIDTTGSSYGNTFAGMNWGSFWDGPELDFAFVNSAMDTTQTTITPSCPTGHTFSAYQPYNTCDEFKSDLYQVDDVLLIESEQMLVTGHTNSFQDITVTRGYNATSAAAHAASTLIKWQTWDTISPVFLIDEIVIADSKIGALDASASVSKSIGGGSLGGGSW